MSGRVIVVTGAAGDIGRAISTLLRTGGDVVVGVDRVAAPGIIGCDLTDEVAVAAAFADIARRHGPLDGLVASAGVYEALDAAHTTVRDMRRLWEGNVLTAWTASMAFAAHCAPDSAIVTLASISAHGSPDVSYGSAKAGVVGLTKSLALHFGPSIRVNAIAPGVVDGSMADRIPPERSAAYRARSVLGRLGTPDDVAAAAAALLGPAAAWMTGTVLDLDGGKK